MLQTIPHQGLFFCLITRISKNNKILPTTFIVKALTTDRNFDKSLNFDSDLNQLFQQTASVFSKSFSTKAAFSYAHSTI